MSTKTRCDVVVFAPHPDDAELCCGGTLATLAAQGHRVAIVDLTRGELASNGTPETRAEEAAQASAALGLAHRENLGLPDGFLTADAGYGTAAADAGAGTALARLVETLRRLKPSLVLAPWRQARHPDHRVTSELVRRAVFFAGVRKFGGPDAAAPHTVARTLFYQMRFVFTPSIVVDVTEALDAKRQAIACYGSQVTRQDSDVATLANAPLGQTALQARDQYYGAMIGRPAGEPFAAEAPVAARDLLALHRDHGALDHLPLLFTEPGG